MHVECFALLTDYLRTTADNTHRIFEE